MALAVKLTKDDISPQITRLVRGIKNPLAVLRAMGTTFKSITEGTFNSVGASYRPVAWPPKSDGKPCILQKSTTMAKSFHLEVTNTYARLFNPMIYAPIQQFGGVIKPKTKPRLVWKDANGKFHSAKQVKIPARPFFPVKDGKLTPKAEEKIVAAGRRVIEGMAGKMGRP